MVVNVSKQQILIFTLRWTGNKLFMEGYLSPLTRRLCSNSYVNAVQSKTTGTHLFLRKVVITRCSKMSYTPCNILVRTVISPILGGYDPRLPVDA